MILEDWETVATIYAEGIATGYATFEKHISTYDIWDKTHLKSCRLVAVDLKKVLGWAALSPVSGRSVYQGVAEVSVYVGQAHSGNGVGSLLMKELILQSEKNGFWTLQSSIFPENEGVLPCIKRRGFAILVHGNAWAN
ncbi:MAG: N-acetyltransferase family protein [Maribacter sp.]|uniref:GNAT family N-acetyltransferase n=1 Tax=Maribacter sp. TaxID=1897614 RepID=UPI003C7524AA